MTGPSDTTDAAATDAFDQAGADATAGEPTDPVDEERTDATAGEPTDRTARHLARATLYGLGAMAFGFPDEDTWADLEAAAVRQGATAAAATLDRQGVHDGTTGGRDDRGAPDAPDRSAAAGLGRRVAALLDAVAATDRAAVAGAYNTLFGIPTEDGGYAVPPYEAHYTVGSEIGQQQRRLAALVGLLRAVGVEPSDGFAERQDHVVAELELAQLLAAQRAVALAEGDDAAAERVASVETRLLADHLVGFVPAFAHDLAAATDDPVYRAAADLVAALVRADHRTHVGAHETDANRQVPASATVGEVDGDPPRDGDAGEVGR